MSHTKYSFIPATLEREVHKDIVYRPIRSWSSNTYAGERLTIVDGDRSGCINDKGLCNRPYTVTHRIYWNKLTDKCISAFLSYPNGMGACNEYFWEIYPSKDGDIDRFSSEEEMEKEVIELLRLK